MVESTVRQPVSEEKNSAFKTDFLRKELTSCHIVLLVKLLGECMYLSILPTQANGGSHSTFALVPQVSEKKKTLQPKQISSAKN